MERSIEIIDNFLPEELHTIIKNTMMGSDFPWFLLKYKVGEGLIEETPLEDSRIDFQFTHSFYKNFSPQSHMFNLLVPLLDKLKPSALIRVKGNLTVYSEKNLDYHYHIDTEEHVQCKTAIYYVNSNNGFTEFDDGTIVESVENRVLIFNSKLFHTGTTCTNKKRRIVVNLNYF